MQIQVLAVALNDEGAPIWNYNHLEVVPSTGDAEQMALVATGMLTDHLHDAKEAIAEQSSADLKLLQDEDEEQSP